MCFTNPNQLFQESISSVQSLSCVRLFAIPWMEEPGGLQSMGSQRVGHDWATSLHLFQPLLLLLSIFPSIRVFSSDSVLHIRWPTYWSLSLSINPSNEYSGLISFRIDWLDLLAVQGALKSLLWHYSSKASILWRSAFFIVQLSHPYMTTGKP